MDIQTQDGILLKGIPDGTPDDVIKARLAQIRAGDQAARLPRAVPSAATEAPSWFDQQLAKVPTDLVNNAGMTKLRQFVTGAADPVVGTAQLAANILPDSTGIPGRVNQAISEKDRALQAERMANAPTTPTGEKDPGFDWTRAAGNLLSPATILAGARIPMAATTGGRALQGAGMGAAGGASAPIENAGENFWPQKGVQTAVGTLGGAILGPVVGKIGDAVGSLINRVRFTPANAGATADEIINVALKEANQRIEDIPAAQLASLRQQVAAALSEGKQLNAPAALRKLDFDAEAIKPTLGQITRDPMQFAAEQNLRGVRGVGEPLTAALAGGNRAVSSGIGQYGASAAEAPIAAQNLAAALRQYDEGKQAGVSAAYKAARQSTGKDLDIPLQGLAQDYADVLHRYAEKVPGGVRNAFEDFGLSGGTQSRAFNFDAADQLLKTINSNKSGEIATNAALSELRTAVKKAQTSVDATGGPFAPAVKLAAERFKLHDEIPALEAAASGNVDDRFVQKFVLNNTSTAQTQKLAALLKEQAPEAYQEVRSQIGAELSRKAFGENLAGDRTIAQESYNRAIRNIGTGKLNAFFEPQEVEQLKRLGRIAAYQTSPPAGAASNYSNTSSALANLLRAGAKVPIAGRTLQFAGDKLESNTALAANVPTAINLTPAQRAAIAKLLSRGVGGSTGGMAPQFPDQSGVSISSSPRHP